MLKWKEKVGLAWKHGEKQELQKQQKGRMGGGREVNERPLLLQKVIGTGDCRTNKTQKQKILLHTKAV